MITITPAARTLIAQLCADDERGRSFRIFIKHKGCDGLHFGFGLDEPIEQDSMIFDDGIEILVSTRLARLIRGGELRVLETPRVEDFSSGCTPPPPEDSESDFLRFDLHLPDETRFRGKFYKHSTEQELHWDTLA